MTVLSYPAKNTTMWLIYILYSRLKATPETLELRSRNAINCIIMPTSWIHHMSNNVNAHWSPLYCVTCIKVMGYLITNRGMVCTMALLELTFAACFWCVDLSTTLRTSQVQNLFWQNVKWTFDLTWSDIINIHSHLLVIPTCWMLTGVDCQWNHDCNVNKYIHNYLIIFTWWYATSVLTYWMVWSI